jgi:hypothetical protein
MWRVRCGGDTLQTHSTSPCLPTVGLGVEEERELEEEEEQEEEEEEEEEERHTGREPERCAAKCGHSMRRSCQKIS